MDFPLIDLMDERARDEQLVVLLHPDGLVCPRCGAADRLGVHRRHRDPVVDSQCGHCRRAFNAFTGTPSRCVHRPPTPLRFILRGIADVAPTARMPREPGCDRKHPLRLQHWLQCIGLLGLDRNPLGDATVEADEAYVNAGEKGACIPTRPARRRGHGTFDNDRPSVARVVGWVSAEIRVEVLESSGGAELEGLVEVEDTTVNTDEWRGYSRLGGRLGWVHVPVDRSGSKGTWALGLDGDGIREVHYNSREGLWTGLRIFLSRFRRVIK